MERRLAAILAADVVGYSRLMGEDETGTLERLKSLRKELVQPKITARKGRIVKLMGDGLLAEFPSVVEAVNCAVEIQQAMIGREAELPDERRLRLRIGVNLGDIIVEGSDIYGDGVNVAARLEGLAEPGGVCISGKVHEEVRGRTSLSFKDSGEQVLKNIIQPVHVWRWSADQRGVDPGEATPDASLPLPDKPSIAVLPFDNMSGDVEMGFFGDGIAEDIITALSKVSGMRVIARNSTFAYKGASRDVRRIAEELGVRYVMEGSIRRGGKRLRVTAQLIDAGDGSHIWAERFDRVVDDLFDIQDEITKEIVTALRVNLTDGESAAVWARGTNNIEAWQYCVRATELFLHLNASDYLEARSLAERAVALDPNYAHAWAVLGFTYFWEGRLSFTGTSEASFAKADELANHAMELDSTVAWAIGLRTMTFAALDRYEESIAMAESGVARFPGNADTRAFLGFALVLSGRHVEAIENITAAIDLNPHHPNWYRISLARSFAATGRLEKALALTDQAILVDPTYFQSFLLRAAILVQLDRKDEAREDITKVRKAAPQFRARHIRQLELSQREDVIGSAAEILQELGLPP